MNQHGDDKRLIQMLKRSLELNDELLRLAHDRPDLWPPIVRQRTGLLQALEDLQNGLAPDPKLRVVLERVAKQLEDTVLRAHRLQEAQHPKVNA